MADSQKRQGKKPGARVIAVTSGRGGVGKTNFSASLSIVLAELGNSVTLLDMDLGQTNVSMLLDIKPEYNLDDIVSGNKGIDAISVTTQYGVRIVRGASGDEVLAELDDEKKKKLVNAMERLCIANDYVIIDTGAGYSKNTGIFTESADEVIVVTTPGATSMMDAYAAIKLMKQHVPDMFIHLVVNMARGEQEARNAISKLQSMASHFIHGRLEEDGFIPMDDKVKDAVKHHTPFIIYDPACFASLALTRIANTITNMHTSPSGHIHDRKETFYSRLLHAL